MRGVGEQRVLTDLVSLVRHAVQLDDELVPYPEQVRAALRGVAGRPGGGGRKFTAEQRWWLDRIAEHIGVNLAMTADDFDYGEFFDRGGRIAARKQFGRGLPALLDELNAALVRRARSPRPPEHGAWWVGAGNRQGNPAPTGCVNTMGEDVMRERGTLPPGWVWTTLGEVSQHRRDVNAVRQRHTEQNRLTPIEDEGQWSSIPAPREVVHRAGTTSKPGDVSVCKIERRLC